jgi:hypothetical protein
MNPNSNSNIAALLNIQCRKGDTFERQFTFKDEDGAAIDLSSYTITMTVKDSAGTTVLTFSGGDWTGTPSAGQLTATKSATAMGATTPGTYTYDLQATVGTSKVTWLAGKFIIDAEVTTA